MRGQLRAPQLFGVCRSFRRNMRLHTTSKAVQLRRVTTPILVGGQSGRRISFGGTVPRRLALDDLLVCASGSSEAMRRPAMSTLCLAWGLAERKSNSRKLEHSVCYLFICNER